MWTTLTQFRSSGLCSLLALTALVQGCASQREFDSPDQAVASLVQALRANDLASLKHVLGPDSDELISSGDPVEDRYKIDRFLQVYDAKHNLVAGGDGEMTLVVGQNEWPLPIPLVKDERTGKWRFDTVAGKDELISRRIGRNELAAIQTCLAIVDAQKEYSGMDSDGDGVLEYARKFFSDPGKKNGLYWETAAGERPSPLGPLVGEAEDHGYSRDGRSAGSPRPYHGYVFRILESQGSNAAGGAINYLIGGKMIAGFAVIAHPADYGSSGIVTFIVNQDGVVYERDLGENTETEAGKIRAYDPGPGWKKSE